LVLTETIVLLVGGYFGVGLLLAPVSLLLIAPRSDPALASSGKSVRLLLLPGAVAVWPIALWRWTLGRGGDR